MYKFYYGNTLYPIRDLTLDSVNNDFDVFSGTLLSPNSTVKTAIANGGHIYPTHEVRIEDWDGTQIFGGFLENVEEDGYNLKLEGRDYKVLLLDESSGRDVQYINKTGKEVIESLLAYSTKVSHTIAGDYPETITGTMHFDNTKLLRAISTVCEIYGKDYWITYTGGEFKLNIGTRGTVRTSSYTTGREVKVANYRNPVRDMINRQTVFGAGTGVFQVRCCVPWIDIDDPDTAQCAGFNGYNASCVHATASASQTTYGVMEGTPYVDTGITSLDVAIATAKAILDSYNGEKMEIEFAKYVPGLGVGDTIRVVDPLKSRDATSRIKQISRDFAKRRMDVVFYDSNEDLADIVSAVSISSGANNVGKLGATNLIDFPMVDNCGPGTDEELNLRFRLPTYIKVISEIRLSFYMKPYRAYSKSVASSASHTHNLGLWEAIDGYPIYHLGIQDRGSSNVLVGPAGTPSAAVSSSSGSHTHDISFGIQLSTLTDPSVSVYAGNDGSETLVGTYTTDQIDLDLTALFAPNAGWCNIKIVPNKIMQIQAYFHAQVYVEN